MRITHLLIPVLILSLSIGNELPNDWSMFMHDLQHTGYTESLGPADESISWVYDFGSPLYSSPVVGDGVCYQGSREYLCAFDMDTGALLWETELAGVGSTPAVSGNTLVVATDKGISAVNIRTGTILWTYEIKELHCVPSSRLCEYFISSPVVSNSKVLVGTGTNMFSLEFEQEFKQLLCLNIQSGELLWNKESWSYVVSSPGVQNGTIYFASELVEAVDLESGQEMWHYHPPGWQLISDLTIVREFVVFSDPKGIRAVDVNTGDLAWRTELESGTSAIATNGTQLVGATAASLVCLDVDTGSLLWEKPFWERVDEPIDFPKSPSPVIAKDRIYVGSRNGSVYCVKLEDGTLLWEYETGGPVVASPAVVSGKLYIGSTDGKLYCFGIDPKTYFEKAEKYEQQGDTERAREFYTRARDYYQSQGNFEMVKKCEDKLEEKNYFWVLIPLIICVTIGILLIYRKMHRKPM